MPKQVMPEQVMPKTADLNRRAFLKHAGFASGCLLLGFNLYPGDTGADESNDSFTEVEFNAFIRINTDGSATLLSKNPEIGQGIRTALPMILAEELDLPWDKVTVEPAPLNEIFGTQVAGGSQGVTHNYEPLRKAGASVRAVLVEAAARQWRVPAEKCRTERGLIHCGNRQAHYGQVARAATKFDLPVNPPLKDPKTFRIIGHDTADVDLHKIVTGQPLFGIDQEVEGMVYASVVKPEVFGSTVVSFNADSAKKVSGVIDVIKITGRELRGELSEGVAVVANNIWAVLKAKDRVQVQWRKPDAYTPSMAALREALKTNAEKNGAILRQDGDVDKSFSAGKKDGSFFTAAYHVPFVSHSQMEPINFIADVKRDSINLIGPTQTPANARRLASAITGIDEKNITVNFVRAGGGFGRRLYNDCANEAVYLSQKLLRPVQVVWSREDDFRSDLYRPAGYYRLRARLLDKHIDAFEANICTTSRNIRSGNNRPVHKTEAFPDQQPAGMVPNLRVTYAALDTNVPVGALRTPGVNATTFAYQTFLDELAKKASMDPIDFHLQLIGKQRRNLAYNDHGGPSYSTERLRRVIELVREKSAWNKPAPKGVFKGFAGQMVFGTYVAQVVELSMDDKALALLKVTAAIDCGRVINPIGANAQIQGGITDAIGAALYEKITLNDGRLIEQNFHRYRKLRIDKSPAVAVHFVPSEEHPQGLGEPSYPVLFPALGNAIYAATGRRIRELPISEYGFA